jgi:hypothetical protein
MAVIRSVESTSLQFRHITCNPLVRYPAQEE